MGSVLDEVIEFSNMPNSSSCTVAQGLIQTLSEISTRNLPGDKGQLTDKADNLIAISEQIV
jgi:hypothetical protein